MNLNRSNSNASNNNSLSIEDLHRKKSTDAISANNELESTAHINQSSIIPGTSFRSHYTLNEDLKEEDTSPSSTPKKVSTIKQISKIRIKPKKPKDSPQIMNLPQIIEPSSSANEISKNNSLGMPPIHTKGQRRESFLHRADFEPFDLGQKVRKSSMNSNEP